MFLFTGKKSIKTDHGTYVGEVRKRTQIKEGKGKFDYGGGISYDGDWKNDKRHGQGIYLNIKSGEVYKGEWANDKQNGPGILTYSNGDVYSGNWLDDEKSGQGTLTFSNKDVYKGEFSSDKMHGHGVYKEYTIMSTYTGEFKEGKKHGAFIIQPYVGNVRHVRYNEGEVVVNKIAAAHVTASDLTHKASSLATLNKTVFDNPLSVPLSEKKTSSNDPLLNNTTTTDQEQLSITSNNVQTITEEDGIYVGEVRAGTEIKEGKGKFTWTDGDSYDGEWENGNKSGHGTYFLSNGAKYEGMYQENKMHGKGTFTYPNRDVYVGDFINGSKHGQGTYTCSNGEVYIGEWKDDKKNGKGCCGSAAGDLCEAIYVNGLRRGYGTVTFINGDVWSGEYVDDLRVSGTMKYKNGDIYEGFWKLGNRHGYGKMSDVDGTVWEGEWCEDVKVETKLQVKQMAVVDTAVATHPLKPPAFTTGIGAKSDINNFQQTRLSELTALYPQLISLSHHSQQFQSLATASPQTIEYLKSLGDSGVIAEQQYALILSNPLMHEYYIAYIQSVSSAVLACQTINSGMVLNNKRSKPEKIMKYIGQAANSVGFPGVSIATGVCTFLLKLPNDALRAKSVSRVTTAFPSIDSHKYIEMLARELTLLQQDQIKAVATNAERDRCTLWKKAKQAVEWFKTLDNATAVQCYASSHASSLLDKLMSTDPSFTVTHGDIQKLIAWSTGVADAKNTQQIVSETTSVFTSATITTISSAITTNVTVPNASLAVVEETESLKAKLAAMELRDRLREERDQIRDAEMHMLREESEKNKRVTAALQKDLHKLSPKDATTTVGSGGQAQAMLPQPTAANSHGSNLDQKVDHHEQRIDHANVAIVDIISHLGDKDAQIEELMRRLAALESSKK